MILLGDTRVLAAFVEVDVQALLDDLLRLVLVGGLVDGQGQHVHHHLLDLLLVLHQSCRADLTQEGKIHSHHSLFRLVA